MSKKQIPFKFYKTGVSHEDNQRDRTLGNLIKANGHKDRHITMIKMDVEGAERKGLDVWLSEGALDNVQQLAIEYHLTDSEWFYSSPGVYLATRFLNVSPFAGLNQQREFLLTVQKLNQHQFRTISWEANSCFQNMYRKPGSKPFFLLAEIVWVRIPNHYNVSEHCGY